MSSTICKIILILLASLLALSPVIVLGSDSQKELVQQKCSGCHPTSLVSGAKKSEKEWEKTVDRMIGYGVKLSETEREALIHFLSEKD